MAPLRHSIGNNLDGQYGKVNTSTGAYNAKDNVFGGLVMTTFRF